ncbi:MAG: hypothetical protein U0R81_00900 [Mycobacterium sp.]
MLSTVLPVVWLVSALCLFIPAVLVVWATGRDGRKSRELRSLYRQVIAARREHGRQWATIEGSPDGYGLETAELKHLIVTRRSR